MRLNLCRVRVPADAKALDEVLRNAKPVKVWICRQMSVQVTSGSVELTHDLDSLEIPDLASQTVGVVGDLLADCRRRGTLTVRSAHHGYIRPGFSCLFKTSAQVAQLRQHYILHGVMHHERVRQIINIFGRAREVEIFFECGELVDTAIIKLLFEEVLDGFDVVVGSALYCFNAFTVGLAELFEYLREQFLLVRDELDLLVIVAHDALLEQSLIPLQLNVDAESHERKLAEVRPQLSDFAGVATIQRRNICQLREISGTDGREAVHLGARL